jgi:two-component system response regulator DegU
MDKTKILLVDDHPLVRECFGAILNSREDLIVIDVASNGADAVEKAIKLKPNVIVMDINMPIMNGIEATKKIKEINNKVKILIFSMVDNEKYIIDALSNGADSYLNKDADLSELFKVIRKLANDEEYINNEITKKILSYVSRHKVLSPSISKILTPFANNQEIELLGKDF